MKKIVNYMDSVYLNRPSNQGVNKKHKINFWCPTGMIPVEQNIL